MKRLSFKTKGVKATFAIFRPENGRGEAHGVLLPEKGSGDIGFQVNMLEGALSDFLGFGEGRGFRPVMKRFFLSDPTNQHTAVRNAVMKHGTAAAVSMIGQAPLYPGVKVGMLVIMLTGSEISGDESKILVKRGVYTDLWAMNLTENDADSYSSTMRIFGKYSDLLASVDMTLENNCIRTWFYVRDIDNRYKGMVAARNEEFEKHGLTPATHYIASTGIEGSNAVPTASVTLDAIATRGLKHQQIEYLKAKTHLNATSEYGVAFERGTSIVYGDRKHLIISGTASIDNKGNVVGDGDIDTQTKRMIENVESLLREGGGSAEDVAHIILYVRDISDSHYVKELIDKSYPSVPCIVVKASVCRPAWLVEMECMAIVPAFNGDYAPY